MKDIWCRTVSRKVSGSTYSSQIVLKTFVRLSFEKINVVEVLRYHYVKSNFILKIYLHLRTFFFNQNLPDYIVAC